MKTKKQFEAVYLELYRFSAADVIETSGDPITLPEDEYEFGIDRY